MQEPATPAGYKPRLITPPEAPNEPIAPVLTPPTLAVSVRSSGNGGGNVIIGNGSNGRIQSVAIAEGDFEIVRTGNSSWTYKYSGYKGSNVFAIGTATSEVGLSAASNTSWGGDDGISGNGSGGGLGFQSIVGTYAIPAADAGFLSNGNFLYTRAHEKSTDTLGEFVHQDVHGAENITKQRKRFEKAIELAGAGSNLASKKDSILNAYDDTMTFGSLSDSHTWLNSGKIVIEGGNTSLTNTYTHQSSKATKQASINTGEVIFQPYKIAGQEYKRYTAAFVISNDTDAQTENIKYNGPTGKIKSYTMNAVGFVIDPARNRKVYMVNRGDFEFYGESSAGIYVKRLSDVNLQTVTKNFVFNTVDNKVTTGEFKPIKIFGDKSIGYYNVPSNGNSTTTGNFAVDIGAAGKGNQNFSTTAVSNKTAGENITDLNINPSGGNSGKNTNIEGSFGILSDIAMNLASHQIRIYDKTERNVGVYPNKNVLLNIGGGNIELNGGTGKTSKDNIGIYVDGKGAVKSTGDVKVNGGVGNLAIFAVGSSAALPSGATAHVTVRNIEGTNTKNSVLVYGKAGAKIVATGGLTMTGATVEADATVANKKDTGAAFAEGKGTEITINRTALSATENISITGTELKDDTDPTKGIGR